MGPRNAQESLMEYERGTRGPGGNNERIYDSSPHLHELVPCEDINSSIPLHRRIVALLTRFILCEPKNARKTVKKCMFIG
jgi:hypothetical protein